MEDSFLHRILFLDGSSTERIRKDLICVLDSILTENIALPKHVGAILIQTSKQPNVLWLQALFLFVVPGNKILLDLLKKQPEQTRINNFLKDLPAVCHPSLKEPIIQMVENARKLFLMS